MGVAVSSKSSGLVVSHKLGAADVKAYGLVSPRKMSLVEYWEVLGGLNIS